MTDLLPDDDSFVRTAIRGLRVPSHGPDFWDQLAWQLDEVADDMVSQGLMGEVLHSALLPPDLAEPEPSPHHVEDPWPEPEAGGPPGQDPEVDLFGPVEDPVYEDELDEDQADDEDPPADRTRVWAPAARTPAPRAPLPRVRHDRAVVPQSLRRPTTVVLLVLAVLGAALAVAAGLKLVHQRSDSAPAVSTKQAAAPVEPGAPVVLEPVA